MPRTLAVLALTLLAALPASAQLLPPAAGDLVATDLDAAARLVAPVPAKAAATPRDPVAISWQLDADETLAARPQAPRQQSREYWLELDADALRRGAALPTVSHGALIRINPAPGVATAIAAIDPASLEIRAADGRRFDAGAGMDQLATAAQLEAAGVPFVAGTSAFRLAPEVGSGRIEVAAPRLDADGRFVVHVLEATSPVVLELVSDRLDYLHGDLLTVTAALAGEAGLKIEELRGMLVAPGGRAWPLRFRAGRDGSYRASRPLDALAARGDGLWEVHVTAHGRRDGQPLMRFARTAFACAVPTARLTGEAIQLGDARLAVELAVEAAAAARYELRGTVYGTDADGTLRPLAIAHSGDWLEPGEGRMTLAVDAATMAESRLTAPYEVRDLQLLDPERMGVLHRQAVALRIDR